MSRDKLLSVLTNEMTINKNDFIFRIGDEDYDRIHVPSSVIHAISELPEVLNITENLFNQGYSRISISTRQLAQALILNSLASNAETAVTLFFDFLADDHNHCIEVLLLGGLEVRKTFELSKGIFISRLEDAPSDTLKEFISKNFNKEKKSSILSSTFPADYTEVTRKPTAVLYRLEDIKPKFVSPEKHNKTKSSPLLNQISMLLALIGPSSPIIRRGYRELQQGSFLSRVVGRNMHAPYEETRVESSYLATPDELTEFKQILVAYLALSEKRRSMFEVPLHRLNEAVRHKSHVDKAIDLGVAFESLLLDGDKVQLTLQLRLRGAWLLGENVEDRKRISKLIRDLYSLRSSSVHTGKLSNDLSDDENAVLLKQSIELCAAAIKALIISKVDWESLILGGNKRMSESP